MSNKGNKTSRREFVKSTSTAVVGGTVGLNLLFPKGAFATNQDTIKVGLIGCGGRGSGAANQALAADTNVVLHAMGDAFEDRLQSSLKNLADVHPDKVKVSPEHQYVGFDAYQKVIDSGVDVVLLATPPCFRPDHLTAAIQAGKHVFCEKPMAVDVPGLQKIYQAARMAKEKNLSLMSGFCWRYHFPKRETFQRILEGEIGQVRAVYNTYNTHYLWHKERQQGWTDMEYKLRNWLYHNWLSGDHIAEQAIHSLDMMVWALGNEMPVRAMGTGGRQRRVEEIYGNVYDHFAISYDFDSGAKGFHFSRQQKDTTRAYHLEILGTKGSCLIDCNRRKHEIFDLDGKKVWRYRGDVNDMYQTEHDELFAAIRKGEPINDGEWMANSTLLALWGRMVAYTGQAITKEEVLASKEVLGPDIDAYNWDLAWENAPIAKPGITAFK
ncbi:MAG: Gfo/Idh/MocA family oxidoreductase [Bacteroidota bacterium]